MNKKLTLVMVVCIISLTGCVRYKYPIYPNGKPVQMGSYIQDSDFYMKSHFRWTDTGKKIIKANERVEEYYRTNKVDNRL